MLLMLMMQIVACYINWVVEAHDATDSWTECLKSAGKPDDAMACYMAYVQEASDALAAYFTCVPF